MKVRNVGALSPRHHAPNNGGSVIVERKAYLDKFERDRKQFMEDALDRIATAERLQSLMTALEVSNAPIRHQASYTRWKGWDEQYLRTIDPKAHGRQLHLCPVYPL